MNNIRVGTKLKLNTNCLGNEAGTIGVCYDTYTIGGRWGYSFIFPNGRYDGFSNKELDMFFQNDYIEHDKTINNYKFQNVMQLSKDFDNGVFDEPLNIS